MKIKAKRLPPFSVAAGCVRRRSARAPRRTVCAHNTPVYIWRDGEMVAEKP
jgi:hypothetical protein